MKVLVGGADSRREIIFVNMRNDQGARYEWDPLHPGGSCSYTDFWRLVELSVFKTCEIGEVDFESDNTYIFSPGNGNSKAAFSRPHKCRLIQWHLERHTEVEDYPDEIWVSDRYLAKLMSHPKVKYVTLGGHPNLGKKRTDSDYAQMSWDFVHLSYLYGEREAKTNELIQNGFTVAEATNIPEERELQLLRSRYGLCLHQNPIPIIEPLRYVLFACWQLPIVAENSEDYFPYRIFPLDAALKHGITGDWTRELSEYNYRMVTQEKTFRGEVEKAVAG